LKGDKPDARASQPILAGSEGGEGKEERNDTGFTPSGFKKPGVGDKGKNG